MERTFSYCFFICWETYLEDFNWYIKFWAQNHWRNSWGR